MNKITTADVKMAQMAVSNLQDETRTYDITANVTYKTLPNTFGMNQNGQVSNGTVNEDGKTIATFSMTTDFSVSYLNASYLIKDTAKQQSILSAVQEFCAEAVDFAKTVTLSATRA